MSENQQTARLRLRRIGIDTYRENVAFLHRDCPLSGEPLYRIHAEHASGFGFARQATTTDSGFRIGAAEHIPRVFAEF